MADINSVHLYVSCNIDPLKRGKWVLTQEWVLARNASIYSSEIGIEMAPLSRSLSSLLLSLPHPPSSSLSYPLSSNTTQNNTHRSGLMVTILWSQLVRWFWTATLRTTLLRWSRLCLSHPTCHLELNHLPTKCSRYWFSGVDFHTVYMILKLWYEYESSLFCHCWLLILHVYTIVERDTRKYHEFIAEYC